ncbi:hypothetical protein FA95DRAFT_1280084 [Auriscalpium vulgare]|uniref:Uncharacterized protein n=1 Tax=Auriscalpium vulgare TaxID=40419 RepID=A0ACB8R3U7_9AGAM|nr:hypothetical protein FA95DRAFT_1280084 [Auriscalpium vulgare]
MCWIINCQGTHSSGNSRRRGAGESRDVRGAHGQHCGRRGRTSREWGRPGGEDGQPRHAPRVFLSEERCRAKERGGGPHSANMSKIPGSGRFNHGNATAWDRAAAWYRTAAPCALGRRMCSGTLGLSNKWRRHMRGATASDHPHAALLGRVHRRTARHSFGGRVPH